MDNQQLEILYNNCIEYSNKIKNPILKDCCKRIYHDYKEKLINKPATSRKSSLF